MIGKQFDGGSSEGVYSMALRVLQDYLSKDARVLDVGGGDGAFSKMIKHRVESIILLDHDPPNEQGGIVGMECDLNNPWPVRDDRFDLVVALEVIEHLENPRFFFREVQRVLKSEGVGFVSTPNNESLFSKIYFFLNGEHRYFQDSCYPAHITPLVSCDFNRICNEVGLDLLEFHFSSKAVVPKLGIEIQGGGKLLSGNMGALVRKKRILK